MLPCQWLLITNIDNFLKASSLMTVCISSSRVKVLESLIENIVTLSVLKSEGHDL